MQNIKEINIKNRAYYFFNDMINMKDFDSSLPKIDKQSYKNIGIYNIGYITIKNIDDYENIHSVNSLYLMIGKVIEHIKENNGNKYLVFGSADGNKKVLKKFIELWDGIKNKIQIINGDKTSEYGKDFMKIKFDSDDDLPLNKQLKVPTMKMFLKKMVENYPHVYLDECLYEL